jgi:hypothetical protein
MTDILHRVAAGVPSLALRVGVEASKGERALGAGTLVQ